jgi:formamidopyrimidine-DNA glycosylase
VICDVNLRNLRETKIPPAYDLPFLIMPEIPDLENFRVNLLKLLKGKKVERIKGNVKTAAGKKASTTILTGKTLQSIERDGKRLHFKFDDTVLAIHLMLHGEFYYLQQSEKTRFPKVEISFTDKTRLVVTDWQKNAHGIIDPPPTEVPDVLSKKMNKPYFRELLNSKKQTKDVLRDQSKIRGLGNAYTDEILWEARISPFSVSNAIPPDKVDALYKAIRKVLKWATNHISRKDPGRITGEMRDFLKVHHAKKEKTATGYKILREKKGGSSTYYTKEQKLYR